MPSTSRSRLSHNNRGDQNRSLNLKYSTRIRSFPQMGNSNQSDQHWKILENAIKEIQRKNNSNLSFEQLYRTSYTMVLHGSGQALYDGTKKAVETHLVKNIRPSIMASSENRFKHASDILKSWEDHRISMSMIKDILMYMDRNHCPKEKVPSTEIMGREVFRDQIISYTPIEKELRKHILERIAQSRLSESAQSSQTQIRDITSMLLILGSVSNTGNRDSSRVREVYEKIIEKPFLAQTSEFYKIESNKLLAQMPCIEYIRHVNRRISEEETRTKLYLDEGSIIKVRNRLIREMVEAHAYDIVNLRDSGASYLIDENKLEELKNLHELLIKALNAHINKHDSETVANEEKSNNPTTINKRETLISQIPKDENPITPLLEVFKNKLLAAGQDIVKKHTVLTKDPQKYIEELIQLKNRYDNIVSKALNRPNFKSALNKEFETFMNDKGENGRGTKTPEFLSCYIDRRLSKSKKSSNNNTEELTNDKFVEQCIALFRLLHEKDSFEKYYKKHLSTRMLFEKISDEDLEHALIQKFQTECGAGFTNKLNQMFNDRQKWIKITEEYQNSENQPGTLELSVKVLTHNNWDLPNGSKLNMKGERIDQETSNSSADPSKNRPQPHQSNTSNSSNMSDITLNNQNTLGSNSVSHTSNLNASSSISASGKVSKSSHSYLPREMTLAFDHFKNYYLKRDNNNNKILTLIPDLGTGDIKFTPQGLKAQGKKLRTYTITTTTTVMVLFMQFNKRLKWNLKDLITELAGLSEKEIKSALNFVCKHPKIKLLNVEHVNSKSSQKIDKLDFHKSDVNDMIISLNDNFITKMPKISLIPANRMKLDDQSKSVKSNIEQDRSHEIQAAIIRVMKSRKKMTHANLVADTINQLKDRFNPEPAKIKNEMETLIDREFLKRTNNNRSQIEYIA